ncbi:MAG: multidrug efflux MATE transporter FepA, partial [Thermoguttaceae bacterium]|nr:multidrug efflux MATE transporter FepA [Thermoguttaceae bacterium]
MTPDSKLFLRYVIPSMASMLIAGSFCIVDTIFIGQGLGELGLAAVGISWPIVMFFSAAADMIGCGAAVLISQARGA